MLWAIPVASLMLLVPLPVQELAQRWPALLATLENSGHAPLFAMLTVLLYGTLRDVRPQRPVAVAVVTAACAMAFGGLTEYVQSLVGRDSSWADLGNDALGTLLGLAWVGMREARATGRSTTSLAAAALTTGLVIIVAWPLASTIAAYLARSAASPVIWRHDAPLLRRFSFVQGGQFPGLVLTEVPHDWHPYSALEVDLQSLSDVPLGVTVRTHDALHNQEYLDRFNTEVWLQPGERRVIHIPMARIQVAPERRTMILARMRGLAVFQEIARVPPRFRVFEIRLVPTPGPP